MACYTSNEMQFTSKNAQAKRTGNHIDTVLFVKYLTVYSGYLPEKQHVDGKIFHQPCFFDKNAPMEYESESLGYCDAHLEGGGMLMSIARGEQETIIRRDVEGLHAWSNVPADIRELKEKGWTLIREDMWGGDIHGTRSRHPDSSGSETKATAHRATAAGTCKSRFHATATRYKRADAGGTGFYPA